MQDLRFELIPHSLGGSPLTWQWPAAARWPRRQGFLFEKVRVPLNAIGLGQRMHLADRHKVNPRYDELGLANPGLTEWPIMTRAEDLNVVIGGPGKHSCFAPPTGAISRSVMKKVVLP